MKVACKLCIMAKGLKGDDILGNLFESEEDMYQHLEKDHGVPVRRENETDAECQERFKRENPAAVIDDEMNKDRVEWLTQHIFEKIMENMEAGPTSRFRVWESLNALAICAATVLNGTEDPRAYQFFQDALAKMRVKVDSVRVAEEAEIPVP